MSSIRSRRFSLRVNFYCTISNMKICCRLERAETFTVDTIFEQLTPIFDQLTRFEHTKYTSIREFLKQLDVRNVSIIDYGVVKGLTYQSS